MVQLDNNRYWDFLQDPKVTVDELASKYNISITAFSHSSGSTTASNVSTGSESVKQADGTVKNVHHWKFGLDRGTRFVINDTNVGVTERAKFHWKNTPRTAGTASTNVVYVLSKTDKSRPMLLKSFFNAINNPPESWKTDASTLKQKNRVTGNLKNVTILELQERGSGGYYRSKEMVWRDAGKADSFDTNTTHYYLPMSGFNPISKLGNTFNIKQFYNDLGECGVASLKKHVYGVRKGDIEFIKTQPNWINIEDYIAQELSKIDDKLTMSLVLQAVDSFNLLQYNTNIIYHVEANDSPYTKLVMQFKGFEKIRYSEHSLKNLCRMYAKGTTFNPQDTVDTFVAQCKVVYDRYPLLQYLRSAPNEQVAEYINLIDKKEGI